MNLLVKAYNLETYSRVNYDTRLFYRDRTGVDALTSSSPALMRDNIEASRYCRIRGSNSPGATPAPAHAAAWCTTRIINQATSCPAISVHTTAHCRAHAHIARSPDVIVCPCLCLTRTRSHLFRLFNVSMSTVFWRTQYWSVGSSGCESGWILCCRNVKFDIVSCLFGGNVRPIR